MKIKSITSKKNQNLITIWHFFEDLNETKEIGRMYHITHPTTPFEIFSNLDQSKKVRDIQEAINWLESLYNS